MPHKGELCEFWEIEMDHLFTEGKNGHIRWRKTCCSCTDYMHGKSAEKVAGTGEAIVKGDRITKPFYAEDLVRKI